MSPSRISSEWSLSGTQPWCHVIGLDFRTLSGSKPLLSQIALQSAAYYFGKSMVTLSSQVSSQSVLLLKNL